MTDTIAPLVPAGWYDDPWDAAAYRWWTGAEWTAHTSPKQAAPVAPEPAYASPYLMSRDPLALGTIPTLSQQVAIAPKGSPQTAGIWLLSIVPLLSFGSSMLATWAVLSSGIPLLAYIGVPFVAGLAWLFAILDMRALERRGYQSTPVWWMLLFPPLAYLIVRGRSVRKQGGRAWPSELAYLGSVAIVLALAVAVGLSSYTGVGEQATAGPATGSAPTTDDDYFYAGTFGETAEVSQTDMEGLLTTILMADGSVPASCANAVVQRGGSFVCEATDTVSGTHLRLYVDFCDCGEVYFSIEVVSGDHGVGNGVVVPQQESAGSIPDEQQPWQPQIENSLRLAGYLSVDCSEAAPLLDLSSTFDCYALVSQDQVVRLNVTITEIGNIGFTEYPLEPADAGQTA